MNKSYRVVTCALAASIALAACSEKATYDPVQQSGPNPPMPKAQNFLVPPMQVPDGTGWRDGEAPSVAAGLRVEKIAGGLLHPRQLLTLPNGDVLVVESNGPGTEPVTSPKQLIAGIVKNRSGKGGKGGNRITLLRKSVGKDGHADTWESHVYIEHLHSPFGVQLIGDTLYVANTDNIMKYHYVPGETRMSDPGAEFTDLPSTINHHWTKSLLASPDGTKLYVGVGSNSNITENGLAVEYRRANVLEVDVRTGASRVYASGIRNPTGLQWEPATGKLWAVVNERDEIGADLVPDYLTSVKEGGFYGWPYSYFGQHVDSRVTPQRPDLVAKAISPDYALGSHVAPLGLLFYRGHGLPERYRGGAFISEHGSWDRSPLSGYAVVYVAFKDGKPSGVPEPILTGFASENEKFLKGAPVGLAEDADGALLVADDVGNAVWRVSAATPGDNR
ncbi:MULTISPECIES: sorbosone dehydrogenase family protein [Pandoraea]|uniref:PQQ-dependent sugar dehydrogenase n=1 Tax=Pandoraea TaxID=93217 RepID=UPI001F5DC8BB|nr:MULTISPECIES: sorbosone dehydrogenase family protein [Pandoraea]MCI3206386.1 L-sorbosone dehydrogenase [Pandoraea sp. LA3]MDN4584414.1 L-sorbosone dehydrogenase [Pandoraea capi]